MAEAGVKPREVIGIRHFGFARFLQQGLPPSLAAARQQNVPELCKFCLDLRRIFRPGDSSDCLSSSIAAANCPSASYDRLKRW